VNEEGEVHHAFVGPRVRGLAVILVTILGSIDRDGYVTVPKG
jgi:hypothetical protein